MAETEKFHGSNLHFGPPPGHEERVGWLHVFANGVHTVSCWRPTVEELERLNRGEPLFVSHRSGCRPDTGLPLVFPVYAGTEDNVRAVVEADGLPSWDKAPPGDFGAIRVIAADVLDYVDGFKGQENDAEEALGFVQDAAQMIAEGKNTYRDFGMAGYAGFVEWLSEGKPMPGAGVAEVVQGGGS